MPWSEWIVDPLGSRFLYGHRRRAGGQRRLLESGDMCSHSPDRGFTGGDAFLVVLTTDSELHRYYNHRVR